jgi:hypothetical protein
MFQGEMSINFFKTKVLWRTIRKNRIRIYVNVDLNPDTRKAGEFGLMDHLNCLGATGSPRCHLLPIKPGG